MLHWMHVFELTLHWMHVAVELLMLQWNVHANTRAWFMYMLHWMQVFHVDASNGMYMQMLELGSCICCTGEAAAGVAAASTFEGSGLEAGVCELALALIATSISNVTYRLQGATVVLPQLHFALSSVSLNSS